jgi:hypothetical protein
MSDTLDDHSPVAAKTRSKRKPSLYWLTPEDWKAANYLADQLQETKKKARRQIVNIVRRMGLAFAQEVLQQTLAVEAEGGLMLPDGSRRRTLGGVFFYLARSRMTSKLRYEVFRHTHPTKSHTHQTDVKQADPFVWADRQAVLTPLLQEAGTATSVKAVFIGLPTHIQSYQGYVILTLTPDDKSPTFPKGVPKPELPPTLYTVYVSAKQWKRVEEASTDPEDKLIIEGMCVYNEQTGGMEFYATSITSKWLEAKKREQR